MCIRDSIRAFPVTATDTSGAGDAFVGSLAAFLAEGVPEPEAVARANLYAALSTTRVGTQKSFPRRAEFDTAWERSRNFLLPDPGDDC